MDNANGQLIVDGVTIDRATFDSYMVSAEHAYDQGMHDSAHQYLGDKAPPFDDAAACRALANRIGQNQRIAQNTERLREIAANPTAYSKDGRLVADLTPSERARHDMMRDDMMRAYASGGK
ncbi:MAG: hypothetical protein R3D70_00840 [Rhizobiaceae bacterium]